MAGFLKRVLRGGADSRSGALDADGDAAREEQARSEDPAQLRLPDDVSRAPDQIEAWCGRGRSRLQQGDARGAEEDFRAAIAIQDGDPRGWANLACALVRQYRYREATAAHATAVGFAADAGMTTEYVAHCLVAMTEQGASEDAIAFSRRLLATYPSVQGHIAYAWALLRTGELIEGWQHFEFRWLTPSFAAIRTTLGRPPWQGQDLRGRTVLIQAEQGFGDEFQFVRLLPMVKATGATVIFHALPGTESLIGPNLGVDQVIGDGQSVPAFDYHAHLLSLPRILGLDLASIPGAVPYLAADPRKAAAWTERLRGIAGRKIGLAWAGNPTNTRDRERSIPVSLLAPLAQVDGVTLVVLQAGAQGAEAAQHFDPARIVDLSRDIRDFGDTAAIIDALDLVISVDTAVAHLAGALGKPVWLLLSEPGEWRWLVGRCDSPWYPTARLFRQAVRGDWQELVQRVANALREFPRDGRAPSAPPTPARPGAPAVRSGMRAVMETRSGIFQYRPDLASGTEVEWALAGALVAPGSVAVEVDAGIGVNAAALAKIVGPHGHVYLIERRQDELALLRANLDANRVGNATVSNGGTVDELHLQRLDLLQINGDCDVPEDVLAGARDSVWRLRPAVLARARGRESLGKLSQLLADFGYRRWCAQTTEAATAIVAMPEESPIPSAVGALREIE